MKRLFVVLLWALSGTGQVIHQAAVLDLPNTFTQTNTFANIKDSGILTGNCVQTTTAGLFVGTGVPCASPITLQHGGIANSSQTVLNLVAGSNITITDGGAGALTIASTGGGGANPILENCTPDQTGNSFYQVASLTNWFAGHWEFTAGQSSFITCEVFIKTPGSGTSTIMLDVFANDSVAGHTANFQTCDAVITTGTLQIGAPTCAANQAFTTTSSAYQRVTLTYNVQSTLASNSILVVKIATSTTGTQPTANMLVYPHFIL